MSEDTRAGIIFIDLPVPNAKERIRNLYQLIEKLGKEHKQQDEKVKHIGLYVPAHGNHWAITFSVPNTENGYNEAVKKLIEHNERLPAAMGFSSGDEKFPYVYYNDNFYPMRIYVIPLRTKKEIDEFKDTRSCDIEYYYFKGAPRPMKGKRSTPKKDSFPRVNIRRMF